MKKFWMGMAMSAALAFGATASDAATQVQTGAPAPAEYPWTFLNIGLFPGMPNDSGNTETYGVKLGIPISGGEAPVYGVEGSVLWSATREVSGIQCSLIGTDADEVRGIQFSLVNLAVKVGGVQIGIVNIADDETFQIGLLNFINNGAVYCLPLVNCKF